MRLKVVGTVEIINGDTHIIAHNKLTMRMASTIASILAASKGRNSYVYMVNSTRNIYLGTDTVTPTTYDMSSLASPIGTSPGTPPDVSSGTAYSPASGEYAGLWTAIWAAGSVSGTVGEIALHTNWRTYVSADYATTNYFMDNLPSPGMVARLSVADGEMTAFTIDTSKPLVVNWELKVS